ncbi:MAG: hypothetical protein QXL02_01945 [Candidatus Anstonellales archaeon]
MYRINNKSFAEKNRDKTDMIKQFGKHSILLYNELESLGSISDSDIVLLANKYAIDSAKLMEFLRSRSIIVEVEDQAKPPTIHEQTQIVETPQQSPILEPIAASTEPPKPQPQIDPSSLTPAEKTIYSKYGEAGVKVLRVYDSKKSFLQIADETGVSIDLVVEITDFIRTANLHSSPGEEETSQNRFAPKIVTDIEEIDNELTDIEEFEINKNVKDPVKKYSIKYKMPLDMSLKFGQDGKSFDRYIDQNPKFRIVDIAIALKIPLSKIKEMLNFISKEYGIVSSRKITRKELRASYGYDSYAIYKKHGVEGLILYSLLGGDLGVDESIRQFAKITDIREPNRIASIINSINEILGVKAIIDDAVVEKALK